MTWMTGLDCAVVCNLTNIHTYIHTYIHTCIHFINIHTYLHSNMHTLGVGRAEGRRKSARNRKIAVDAARETGET